MALEQWEIDLRKQLEGAAPTKRPSTPIPPIPTWEEQLRKEISGVPQPPPVPECVHHRKPNNNQLLPFVFMILLLAGVFAYVLNVKTGFANNWFTKKCEPDDSPAVIAPPPTHHGNHELLAEVRQLRFDIEKMRKENSVKYEELQKKIKWNGDRITLLGMMHNENWLVIRNEGPNSTHYLYFNGDWTLSGMPQYLELTAEDRAFLEKYQKK